MPVNLVRWVFLVNKVVPAKKVNAVQKDSKVHVGLWEDPVYLE